MNFTAKSFPVAFGLNVYIHAPELDFSAPTNYRGVHLTYILTKIVERTIAFVIVPYFDRVGAFGKDQWAFRKKHSCWDLVALLVCRWLWALDNGYKVCIYLSDIYGAFDRVDREILIEYIRRWGL